MNTLLWDTPDLGLTLQTSAFTPRCFSLAPRNRLVFGENKDSYMPLCTSLVKVAQSRPKDLEIPGTKCLLSAGLEVAVTLGRVIRKPLCLEV